MLYLTEKIKRSIWTSKIKYLVRRIVHRRVIRLSIRGLTTSAGSLDKVKNPKVAWKIIQIFIKSRSIIKIKISLSILV